MLQAMFKRLRNADDQFVGWVQEAIGCTTEEAETILRVYRKAKAVKLVASMGRYDLTHGAFADPDVLRRALAQGGAG